VGFAGLDVVAESWDWCGTSVGVAERTSSVTVLGISVGFRILLLLPVGSVGFGARSI